MITPRTTPAERAAWCELIAGPQQGTITLGREDLRRLLDDLEDAQRALCTYPNCAGMRNADDMIQRFKQVADAADLFFHAVQDRVGLDEFEKHVEWLRKNLVKAGYGG